MKSIKMFLFALSAFALTIVPISTTGQSTDTLFPVDASRPDASPKSKEPQAKFRRVKDVVPNRYIVVLNDEVVSDKSSLPVRRSQISIIANAFAQLHAGKVRSIYGTALKGFSIELPSDAAAIALSEDPRVKFVEQVAVGTVATTQNNPPSWGLDRIDQMDLPLSSTYVYNATGSGVNAYIIDTGIRSTHVDFQGRASTAVDFINESGCSGVNNDCFDHGTHVAGIVGGATFGVAKAVTIRALKVCDTFGNCDSDVVADAVDWVTADHVNSGNLAVVNISLRYFSPTAIDDAVVNSSNAGVTYAVAAGNENIDVTGLSPAAVLEAITVGASNITDSRSAFSNIGATVDIFAPGSSIVSASNSNDNLSSTKSGTSMASPHVAGAVALYLQGRTGITNCSSNPKQGPATTSGGAVSTCFDRVAQYIDSNAGLSKLGNMPTGTPNRLLFTGSLPAPVNPIDNQRFFVWQQYADFLTSQPEPDEGGLNFWTGNITGTCGTGFNDNNSCTHQKRIDVSRAFWVAAFPSLFTNGGNNLTDNPTFVHKCYEMYLRRSVPDSDGGFQFWLGELNNDGIPANQNGINHLIDAFMNSTEYRQRFGQP
jgi:subtilisin family serine protease